VADLATRKNSQLASQWDAPRRKPLAVAADAGFPMGFQSIFAWKALPEAAFVKRQLLMLIDLNMNPWPDCDFIVAQDRCFLKPRRSGKSGTSQIVSFEHAKASAAPAASCKRASRTLSIGRVATAQDIHSSNIRPAGRFHSRI